MKTLNSLRVAAILIPATIVASIACTNENELNSLSISNTNAEEALSHSINLVSLEEYLKIFNTRTETNTEQEETEASNVINIIIVKFGLYTKSSGCSSGFGICQVEWFPWFGSGRVDVGDKVTENLRNIQSAPLFVDNQGNQCLYLLLKDSISIPAASITDLVVEEDVMGYCSDSTYNQCLTIVQGEYKYDSNLGQYGGYKVFAEF